MHIVIDAPQYYKNHVLIVANKGELRKIPAGMVYEAERIYARDTGECLKARDGNFAPIV